MVISSSMLPHSITATPYLGEGPYGPQYGPPVQYKARVQFSSGITQDREGRDTQYNAMLFLKPEADLLPDTAVTFIDKAGRNFSLILVSVEPIYHVLGTLTHVEATARYG